MHENKFKVGQEIWVRAFISKIQTKPTAKPGRGEEGILEYVIHQESPYLGESMRVEEKDIKEINS